MVFWNVNTSCRNYETVIEIIDRNNFRIRIRNLKLDVLLRKETGTTKTVRAETKKKEHSVMMKKYWKDKWREKSETRKTLFHEIHT